MSVELLDHMGGDEAIVNAARVSYAKESTWDRICQQCGWRSTSIVTRRHATVECAGLVVTRLFEADQKLIGYLMRNRHGTPFEMVQFKFRVNVPIFVAREHQRHRIGSYNEVSTRYVEMQPEFYTPPPEDMRTQVGKPGHYEMVPMEIDKATACAGVLQDSFERSYHDYEFLLASGVAREVARDVLPLALMTEFIWSVNLRSLLNFLSLRTAATALLEIRHEADQIEQLVREIVPVAMEAWDKNGRVAP